MTSAADRRRAGRSEATDGECWVDTTTASTLTGRHAVVADGHLGLAVRPEVRQLAALAHLGEPLRQPVRQPDRHRHQLGRLADGVAEHDALVARALLVVRSASLLALAGLERPVDALRDVGRLRADRDLTPQVEPSKPDSEES